MEHGRSRRALALASALVGALLAASPATAAPGASLTLAHRYAPVVRIVEQTEPCARGEPYVPTDVRRVLGNPDVALRGPWDGTNIVKIAPTAADLARGLFDYHLDFPGSVFSPGCTYDEWSHRINAGHPPMVYARVVSEPAYPGRIALQYWFFYVFNDFNDKHEGDWEMIQLDFDAATAAEALRGKPALVGYSQHQGAESARWGERKLELVGGTHPVVYPALGSHANYYEPALYLGRSAAEGVGCDDTVGPSRDLRPSVSLIPTARAAYLRADPWLGFEGRWGEQHQGFYNGPTGPAGKLQWTAPLTWAAESWRDRSFVVPSGSSIGRTATGFFCGAVAAGSTVLTALVGNPSPLLIALAVVVVLVLWLASRTRWHPSAPFRLRRRRPWGAIVTSARRLYVGRLRLFLAIGLLFLPLGAVITGVQFLLFRLGGLAALVDTAGSSNAVVDALAFGLGVLFTILGLAIVQTVTALAMADLDAGGRPTALSAYRAALPKLPSVLAGVALAAVVIAVANLTALGTLLAAWLLVRWALLAQVVALEGVPARAALGRSARLVRGNWWRVASLTLFVSGIALLLGPLAGTLLLFATSASFNFVNLVSSVVYAVVLPFVAIAFTYLYCDLAVAEQRERSGDEAADILPAEA